MRRYQVDHVNLLSRREVRALFSELLIYTERLIVPKSFVVHWS